MDSPKRVKEVLHLRIRDVHLLGKVKKAAGLQHDGSLV